MGVMGAMISLELKKGTTDLNLEQCPYCIGNGRLLCGSCFRQSFRQSYRGVLRNLWGHRLVNVLAARAMDETCPSCS